jgi:hypothetical protein
MQKPGTEYINDCSKIYPFNQFKEQIELLDNLVRPGGILIIYNANFRFTDTVISRKYNAMHIPECMESVTIPKFSTKNVRLQDQGYLFSVFIKKQDIIDIDVPPPPPGKKKFFYFYFFKKKFVCFLV